MSETASITTGVAGRYAKAVFDLAREQDAVDALERDIETLSNALNESADLRDVLHSPLYGRTEQEAAIGAVGERMGLSVTMVSTLRLMAQKRRLFVVPQMLTALRERLAEQKGEVTADVTTAKPLTSEQSERLSRTLAESVGREVRINSVVDDSLIGGLVVKVGSRMIDTSIRTKLAQLQNTMKEAR